MNTLVCLSVLACAFAAPQSYQETNMSIHSSSNTHVSSENHTVWSGFNGFQSGNTKQPYPGIVQFSSSFHKTHVEESSNNFTNQIFSGDFNFDGEANWKRIEERKKRPWAPWAPWPRHETRNKGEMKFGLPGFEEKDITVTIKSGSVKVIADHRGNDGAKYWEETRSLPLFVRPSNTTHEFKNGVLTVKFQVEETTTAQKPDREELESHEYDSNDKGIDIETHGTTQNPLEPEKHEEADFDERNDVEYIK